MKTKFVGLLRGLLQRFDQGEVNEVELPQPVTCDTPAGETPPPAAAQPPAAATPPATPAPVEELKETDELELPLQAVLGALPMDLRAKIMQIPPAGATMVIAIEKVLSQLAHGSVKISFGELRLAAPSLFANSGGENDSRPVTLPLNEILARLNPALLSRRPTQKKVEVTEDVLGPFDRRGQGITFTTTPLKSAPAPAPAPAPVPQTVSPVSWPAVPPHPLAPRTPFPARAVTPKLSATPPLPPAITPSPRDNVPRALPAAPIPPVAPAAHPAMQTERAQTTISAPLAELSEDWPEALRLEIAQGNLMNSQVALPIHLVEPALKRGRVIFPWRNVRSWIRPVPPGVSVHDGIELELPLKVIAPLFFGHQRAMARMQRKVTISPEIPDLFFGFPQPQSLPEVSVPPPEVTAPLAEEAAPPPEEAAPLPEETAPPPEVFRPAFRPLDAKLADTNFYIWGDEGEMPKMDEVGFRRAPTPATDFTSRRAMPKDVVARAMALPGVAGALVALQDGLKVASQVPVDLNADTLAAFLPQIFDRLGQSTRELRMGALNNVNFTVGNVPWKIFRVNAVYFAAFGRAGEPLPSARLAQLAAELERKKQ